MTQDSTAEFGPEDYKREIASISERWKAGSPAMLQFGPAQIPLLLSALSLASKAAPSGGAGVEQWRHKKTGHVVSIIGFGKAQASTHPIEEMEEVVIYEHEGKLWVRPFSEFHDGRFDQQQVATPPADLASRSASPGDGETIQLQLNGRLVTVDGIALEIVRTMTAEHNKEVKRAFHSGYTGGRAFNHEVLVEAERFLAYFAGETGGRFVGPGTPLQVLARVRAAISPTPPAPHVEDREKVEPAAEDQRRASNIATAYAPMAEHDLERTTTGLTKAIASTLSAVRQEERERLVEQATQLRPEHDEPDENTPFGDGYYEGFACCLVRYRNALREMVGLPQTIDGLSNEGRKAAAIRAGGA